jgi:hypothetical protein
MYSIMFAVVLGVATLAEARPVLKCPGRLGNWICVPSVAGCEVEEVRPVKPAPDEPTNALYCPFWPADDLGKFICAEKLCNLMLASVFVPPGRSIIPAEITGLVPLRVRCRGPFLEPQPFSR